MDARNINFGKGFRTHLVAVCAACALLVTPAFSQNGEDGVEVSDYGTVDISVQDTDLAQVLQMLSIQSRKNIITSKSVSATVSANLFDVTFYEALDAVLRVNGYRYIEEGNFIYIYTEEEYQAIMAAQRRTESRIYNLDYLSANDANEFITPLLSDVGQASFRGDVAPGMKPDVSDGGADSYAYTAKIVVNDFPENLEAIASLLEELDTPPEQVLVEATVLQTILDESNAFGVDFTVLAKINFTDLTNPLAAVNNLIAGSDPAGGLQPPDNRAIAGTSTVGNTAGPAGLKIGVLSDDIAVFLRVLDEVTDTTVLARPKIMALNRQRAEVLVGARVGYLSTTATETTTTQTVEFLDTGIQLVFRPFISKTGSIRLELKPSVSEASLRTVTDAQGLLVTIPDELTNELTTNVRVRDSETLVLGGLFRESTRITRRQIPLLGDIPILGTPFRGNDNQVDRDEIIFLITPSIVRDEILWAMGDEAFGYTETARVGARAGLLPFSRDLMTSNYNQNALDAYNQGDLDRALYYVNNSLRLNANQPALVQLREKITGARQERIFESSVTERIIRKRLGQLGLDGENDSANAEPEMNAGTFKPAQRSSPMATAQSIKSAVMQSHASHGDNRTINGPLAGSPSAPSVASATPADANASALEPESSVFDSLGLSLDERATAGSSTAGSDSAAWIDANQSVATGASEAAATEPVALLTFEQMIARLFEPLYLPGETWWEQAEGAEPAWAFPFDTFDDMYESEMRVTGAPTDGNLEP
jgi:type IV pilus assembly protein PilQ